MSKATKDKTKTFLDRATSIFYVVRAIFIGAKIPSDQMKIPADLDIKTLASMMNELWAAAEAKGMDLETYLILHAKWVVDEESRIRTEISRGTNATKDELKILVELLGPVSYTDSIWSIGCDQFGGYAKRRSEQIKNAQKLVRSNAKSNASIFKGFVDGIISANDTDTE